MSVSATRGFARPQHLRFGVLRRTNPLPRNSISPVVFSHADHCATATDPSCHSDSGIPIRLADVVTSTRTYCTVRNVFRSLELDSAIRLNHIERRHKMTPAFPKTINGDSLQITPGEVSFDGVQRSAILFYCVVGTLFWSAVNNTHDLSCALPTIQTQESSQTAVGRG